MNESTYAVLSTSACNPYSLAKMKDVIDCGNAACKMKANESQFILFFGALLYEDWFKYYFWDYFPV